MRAEAHGGSAIRPSRIRTGGHQTPPAQQGVPLGVKYIHRDQTKRERLRRVMATCCVASFRCGAVEGPSQAGPCRAQSRVAVAATGTISASRGPIACSQSGSTSKNPSTATGREKRLGPLRHTAALARSNWPQCFPGTDGAPCRHLSTAHSGINCSTGCRQRNEKCGCSNLAHSNTTATSFSGIGTGTGTRVGPQVQCQCSCHQRLGSSGGRGSKTGRCQWPTGAALCWQFRSFTSLF